MFCDIYSLGQGEVNATAPGGIVFGLRNLQVLRGYMFDRVPEEVLKQACGTYGKWEDPGDGSVPKLEIVMFHSPPKVWSTLPADLRDPRVQAAGVGRRADVSIEMRKAMGGAPAPTPRPKPLTIKDVAPDLSRKLSEGASPKPDPVAEAGGANAIPSTERPEVTARPSVTPDGPKVPKIEDLTETPPPDRQDDSEEEPEEIVEPDAGDAEEPEEDLEVEEEEVEEEAPAEVEQCVGLKADGEQCSRSPRQGMSTCYSHRSQEPDA